MLRGRENGLQFCERQSGACFQQHWFADLGRNVEVKWFIKVQKIFKKIKNQGCALANRRTQRAAHEAVVATKKKKKLS